MIVGEKTRTVFLGNGYTEVINYSFVSPESADLLNLEPDGEGRRFVKIINPLTEDQSVMRTNLIFGLLGTMKRNVFSGSENLKIFEQGKIFIGRGQDELPLKNSALRPWFRGQGTRISGGPLNPWTFMISRDCSKASSKI